MVAVVPLFGSPCTTCPQAVRIRQSKSAQITIFFMGIALLLVGYAGRHAALRFLVAYFTAADSMDATKVCMAASAVLLLRIF